MLGKVLGDVWRSLTQGRAAGYYRMAQTAADAGERERAIEYAERALEADPEHHEARLLLASAHLEGRSYDAVLADIHRHLKPRSYIEIGVATGKSLTLVRPETRALGVDPEPAIQFPITASTRLFRETSDAFFAGRDVRAELGGLPVELAFIDGLHHFDQALRDFIHLERLSAPGATILMHDCLPLDRASAQRERRSGFWSGDVWRLIVLLKKHRPELRIHVVAAPPTGLAVIRGLDPSSGVLSARLDALIAEYLRLDYDYLREDRAGKLNIVANDWSGIREVLDEKLG